MKLFNPPGTLALASLFWTASNAAIEIEDLPSCVNTGSYYQVTWFNDHDYQIQDFALVHWENSINWTSRVQTVDHYIKSNKGVDSVFWKVPAVKNNGYYSLVMNALEVNSTGFPDRNTVAYTSSNRFAIHSGPKAPKLYPKEIAGVVVGSIVALALIVGAFVGVARYMRRRRSRAAAAADVSGGDEERYTDAA